MRWMCSATRSATARRSSLRACSASCTARAQRTATESACSARGCASRCARRPPARSRSPSRCAPRSRSCSRATQRTRHSYSTPVHRHGVYARARMCALCLTRRACCAAVAVDALCAASECVPRTPRALLDLVVLGAHLATRLAAHKQHAPHLSEQECRALALRAARVGADAFVHAGAAARRDAAAVRDGTSVLAAACEEVRAVRTRGACRAHAAHAGERSRW
jgi:hypothetical protein